MCSSDLARLCAAHTTVSRGFWDLEASGTPEYEAACAKGGVSPLDHRFARDLAVQLAGHEGLGVELVPASAPDFFMTDTPTAVLVRQVLGAISQFEKASLVAS